MPTTWFSFHKPQSDSEQDNSAGNSAGNGLKINLKKTEFITINTTAQIPVKVSDKSIKEFGPTSTSAFALAPGYGSLTQSYFMERKPRGLQKHPCRVYRPSATPVSAHLKHQVAGDDLKCRSVEESRTITNGDTNKTSEMGLDRTYLDETTIEHYTTLSGTPWTRGKEDVQ